MELEFIYKRFVSKRIYHNYINCVHVHKLVKNDFDISIKNIFIYIFFYFKSVIIIVFQQLILQISFFSLLTEKLDARVYTDSVINIIINC